MSSEYVHLDISEENFENYLKTLDQIPLPLLYNPLGQLPILSTNYGKKEFEKYKHVWANQPLGILFNDNNRVAIIDCGIGDWGLVPFLMIYDRKGNKIDSLGPFKKSGQDMGYYAIEYLTINIDKTITVQDTVITYSLNPNRSDVDETTKNITTSTTKYTIESSGKIKVVK